MGPLIATQVQAPIKQYHLVPSQVTTAITGDTGPAIQAVQTFSEKLPENLLTAGIAGGMALARGLQIGIKAEQAGAAVAAAAMGVTATSALNRNLAGVSAGVSFAQGLEIGIRAEQDGVVVAAAAIGYAATAALQHSIRSNSPSKVTQDLGGYFGQGFGVGILGAHSYVTGIAQGLGLAAAGSLAGVRPPLSAAADLRPLTSAAHLSKTTGSGSTTTVHLLAEQNGLLRKQLALAAAAPQQTGAATARALDGVTAKGSAAGRAQPAAGRYS